MFLTSFTVIPLITTVWAKTSKISYLSEFSAQVSQIVFLAQFERFPAYYKCMSFRTSKISYLSWVQCTGITNRVLSSFERFTDLLQMYELGSSKISYLREISAQVSQIVFSGHLTVVLLITTVWPKNSKSSYLREFRAVVSQIMVSAHLTVLRLITTVWDKSSKSHISVSSVHKYHKSCS